MDVPALVNYMSTLSNTKPQGYQALLTSLKERIRQSQVRAALSVNYELVLLYWEIGREILTRQNEQGWGKKVIEQLANDLKTSFPEMKGLSSRNLGYMKAFAEAWPERSILQAPLAKITWYHNLALIEKLKAPQERLWYAEQTVVNGWSRNVLVMHIEARLYHRQGKAITNFERTLPAPQSDLAQQILKDPYNFDFLTLSAAAQERDIERALLTHLQKFLLELGVGFSFLGSQYPLEVEGEEYRVDLLFYHIKLRCFIVIDLKAGPFKPEYAGKMNFYLAVVDDLLKHPADQPSIGLILCKSKKKLVVEYALRNMATPVGIAEFRHLETLPETLKGSLPTIEDLEAELQSAAASDADDSATLDE